MMLLFAVCFALCAAESEIDVSQAQRENVLRGFGLGSRHQGDLDSANLLKKLDFAGTSLSVAGGVGLAGSLLVVNVLGFMAGDVTKADIYVSSGVLVSGLLMLIGSRILGYQLPKRF